MSTFPFIMWALSVVVAFFVYIAVARVIEKSGLARLGATGNLFTCNPDPETLKAQEEAEAKRLEEERKRGESL